MLDAVAGDVVTELAHSLFFRGTIVSYGGMSGTPALISPADLIFRDVRLRGFWLKHWLEPTPSAQIPERYGRLATPGRQRRPAGAGRGHLPAGQYRDALVRAAQAGPTGRVLFT